MLKEVVPLTLLAALLCLHPILGAPVEDQPLSAAGHLLLQSAARLEGVTPGRVADEDKTAAVTTAVSASGVPHITGCNQFTTHQHSITVEGEVFLKSGNGILPEQCQAACTSTTEFYCAAAVMRAHGACYLTGYKPKGHFMGTHFYRVCKGSIECFIPLRGYTVGGSKEIDIPEEFQWSPRAKEVFCMAYCDSQDTCVGFDIFDRSTKCLLTALSVWPTNNFDTYLRRC